MGPFLLKAGSEVELFIGEECKMPPNFAFQPASPSWNPTQGKKHSIIGKCYGSYADAIDISAFTDDKVEIPHPEKSPICNSDGKPSVAMEESMKLEAKLMLCSDQKQKGLPKLTVPTGREWIGVNLLERDDELNRDRPGRCEQDGKNE